MLQRHSDVDRIAVEPVGIDAIEHLYRSISSVDVVVIVECQAQLLEVVCALGAGLLHVQPVDGRQQRAINTAMIAITTKSSMRVKPDRWRFMKLFLNEEMTE